MLKPETFSVSEEKIFPILFTNEFVGEITTRFCSNFSPFLKISIRTIASPAQTHCTPLGQRESPSTATNLISKSSTVMDLPYVNFETIFGVFTLTCVES